MTVGGTGRSGGVSFSDATFEVYDNGDPTKKTIFSLSGISAATTRTFTLPNTSSELAILAGTLNFTGDKTFSGTLTASGIVTVSSPAAAIGTSTETATYGMGAGATTTGVTKTVNFGTGGAAGSTAVVNIGSAMPGGWRHDRDQHADGDLCQCRDLGWLAASQTDCAPDRRAADHRVGGLVGGRQTGEVKFI